MFLLIILTVSAGEPQLETILTEDRASCFSLQRWVKGETLETQTPVELYCMPVPPESFNEG